MSGATPPVRDEIVRVEALAFGYSGRDVLRGIDFRARAGEVIGLCGPNGAGKSTLLRLILGLLSPRAGRVVLCGDPVAGLERREIARRAALLMQDGPLELPLSAREVVALGRLPHLRRFEAERASDEAAIDAAMELTDTRAFADRRVTELSGGERHRVQLARALAQDTPLLLLDEPTASFDVAHQLQALQLLRAAAARGRAVLVALHDLSLAARSCDRILLLGDGLLQADGPPAQALTAESLARLFRVRARVHTDEGGTLLVIPLAPIDDGGEGGAR
ncbi:MAG TPA: ABC transporter ATP-binding protein [Polyangia bacterium]|jgi:iron complex transport system ATP-binding protein|nr:ABC transporter ATP-binding protein [Polyangia bacterium]